MICRGGGGGGNLKVKHHTFLMMSSMNLCHISSSHVWSVNHQFGSLGVIWSQITSKSTVCSAVCWTVNTSKFRITDPFRDESTGNRLIPFTKGQLRGNCFNVMTSLFGGSATQHVYNGSLSCLLCQLIKEKMFPLKWRLWVSHWQGSEAR